MKIVSNTNLQKYYFYGISYNFKNLHFYKLIITYVS